MGKQRTKVLSRKAEILHESLPEEFKPDFDHNKRSLDKLGVYKGSKTNRNLMAGFITRTIKKGPSVK